MYKFILRIKKRIQLFINIRKGVPQIMKYVPNGVNRVTHISAFSYANAGDTFLPVVLRDLFNKFIGVQTWYDYDVHKSIDAKAVNIFNNSDFIVIGGGGLFLADTCPNEVSGWQWNCSIDMLEQIKTPIIAFALGYNRFRGQQDFKPIFTEHVRKFVSKSVFVGIRNHGSINKLSLYLEEAERAKLRFQPCMTTLTSLIYPNFLDYTKKQDFIAINCAFDRKNLRSSNSNYLVSIARVVKELSKITKIKVYSHLETDKEILPYLDNQNIPYELVELVHVKDILRCYSAPRLVIGMRGHAQMIPFGCLTPIVSIISHDKMKWFLDDINHPEWGADVDDINFESNLLRISIDAYSHYKDRIENVKIAQSELWKITIKNLKDINNILNHLKK